MRLNIIIKERNKSKKLLEFLQRENIPHTTILAYGTASSPLLKSLGLDEVEKEMVYIISDENISDRLKTHISEIKSFKPHGGSIYFSIPLYEKDGEIMEKNSILINLIVNRGEADFYIDVANKAGSTGATVIHGRGSGIEKHVGLFHMLIEPEKDVIMFVVESERKDDILNALKGAIADKNKTGAFLFTLPVLDTFGIR